MTVNLGGVSKIATSMSITTANDFPQRDPQYYQISGSNNGNNFTVIKEGVIVCNATRFNTTTYNFTNTVGYTYYRLVCTNQCNSSETIFQIAEVQLYESPLSNTSYETNNNFSVYPNPTNGSFFIHNATDAPIDLVIISDVSGKQLQSFSSYNLKSNEMNLNGLASGIYFVHITTGDKNIIKKIIKQ